MPFCIGILSDEERHERKRQAAMLYQQFKNRSGPSNPGSKEVPKVNFIQRNRPACMSNIFIFFILFFFFKKGKPNCFNGLTFVLTGVYESLERDEAADIIKEYGGKVTTSLSKKTSYIVVGEEAGLAKIAKADDLGTKRLSEDDLLDLIRTKSGLPSKESQSGGTPSKPSKLKESKPSPSNKKSNGENSKSKAEETPKKIKEEKKTPPLKKEPPASSSNATVKQVKEERKTPKKQVPTSSSTAAGNKTAKLFEKSEDIPIDREMTEHQQNIASVDNKPWVEKYKPTNIKQIIGQQGPASNVAK